MRIRMLSIFAVCTALVLLTGCPSPVTAPPADGEEGGAKYLTGIVYDSVTGDAVSGADVCFGDSRSETESDGSFSISLGETGAVLVDSWLVFKDNYEFLYIDRVSVDSGTNWEITCPIRKSDLSAYDATQTISGSVSFAEGGDVPDGSFVIELYGFDGTWRHHEGELSESRYSITTTETSDDCLLILLVDPSEGNDFVVMVQGVDLSGSPVELDLQEPDSGFIDVEVSASLVGNRGSCYFVTPYGTIPGLFRHEGADPEIRGDWEFAGAASETVAVYNPFDWQQVVWIQGEEDDTFAGLPSHQKQWMSSSAVISFSSPVTLPAVDYSLGPDAGADPAGLELDGAMLSIPPVDGATLYSYEFWTDSAEEMTLGTILSFSSDVFR
jgi:hypothetical protein